MSSPTEMLSEYVAKTKYEDIPEEILEYAKDLILDSMGCAIGGSATQPGKLIADFFKEIGGRPESTILGTGARLPCIHAAYVNSYLADVLEFDDTGSAPAGHPGANIVQAGLAVAEKAKSSGRDLLAAVVVAYEGWGRISQAIAATPDRREQVWGLGADQSLGACIVSSKLLNFNAEQVSNAMGLTAASAPLPHFRKWLEELREGRASWEKTNLGCASLAGVLSALLTSRGFIGTKHVLDGEKGFWVMVGSDRCDFDKITLNLGREYYLTTTQFKPYASCRLTHSSLDAVAEIVSKHKIDVDRILSIRVRSVAEIAANFRNTNPASIIQAQFALPYLLALELLGKSPSKGLSEADLKDPKVRWLAEKVCIELSPEMEERFRQNRLSRSELFRSAEVSIECSDGGQFSERVDIPKGGPENRLTRDELRSKFSHLTAPIIGAEASRALMRDVEGLDSLADVSEMVSTISKTINAGASALHHAAV